MMSLMDISPKPPLIRVNYLYFTIFFCLLLFISICSMVLKENLVGSRFFFLFYAIGQAVMETLLLVFAGWVIRRFCGRFPFWLFIGATFVGGVMHVIDFLVGRVLDLSIFNTISFVFDESFSNFLYLLEASGVPLWQWALFFGLLAALPLLGIAIYKGTDWLTRNRPLELRREFFMQAFVCIPVALLFWDFSASRMIHPDAYTTFKNSLPWKQTFFHPKSVQLLSGKLIPPKSEQEIAFAIENYEPVRKDKPSIFLFVTESLRQDFITEEVAPNLSRFREENIHAERSFSNANCTQVSWFSIFHSQFPFFWNKTKQAGWKLGSPALALFKQLGYKIRVYTSAELGYYAMNQLIFGENQYLADSFQCFEHKTPKSACYADKQAVAAMKQDLAENPDLSKNNLFVIFFDSTHFDYSWPKENQPKFSPLGSEISYFKAYQSDKNIELIKNRYRNAIHYVDSLFGSFLSFVPPDAMIVFTGDHGEEFFDHGHLFHNSHLSRSQTSIPIYMKIKGRQEKLPMLSQMDIMPTLLDGAYGLTSPILQGESALRERQWPYVAIARFNASRCPYEWCLHDGQSKILLQFTNRKNITESKTMRLLSIRSYEDKSFMKYKDDVQGWVRDHFDPAFDRLFQRN